MVKSNNMTREEHDYIEHSKQFDNVPDDCTECDGTGKVALSDCCGAIAILNTQLNKMTCMSCFKPCDSELDTCDDCYGTGEVQYED